MRSDVGPGVDRVTSSLKLGDSDGRSNNSLQGLKKQRIRVYAFVSVHVYIYVFTRLFACL